MSVAFHLCVALASNRSLSVLEAGSNDVTDEGVKRFSEALKLNTTLEGISLWQNLITGHVMATLTHSFCMSVHLPACLSLHTCHVDRQTVCSTSTKIPPFQGAQYLADGMSINKSLIWIGLGNNVIGAEGAWALAEGIQGNSSLQWLGMGGNAIGDKGAMHLANMLTGMTHDCIT